MAVRNAFIMLIRAAPNLALSYLMDHLDSVHKFGTGMQQAVLELVKREVRADPSKKGAFIKIIFQLLNSSSAAVTYEAAGTLVVLSTAPTAVRAAASAYTQLLTTQSDNNIKLILLDRLGDLRKLHPKVMQESLMDVLRSLQSPSLDIRAKALDIALKLVAPRTVDEVVSLLKAEVLRTQEEVAMEHAAEYRGMLIRAIHKVAAKFPDVSGRIVLLLLDFLASKGADEIMAYAREVAETYPSLRADVIDKLQTGVSQADQAPVLRTALWVLGEYSEGPRAAASAHAILDALGEEPLRMDPDTVSRLSLTDGDRSPSVVGGKKKKDGAEGDGAEGGGGPASGPGTEATAGGGSKATTTLADGSYVSQVALGGSGAGMAAAAAAAKDAAEGETPDQDLVPLRRLLLHGNFFLGACVASVLTKLALRVTSEAGPGDEAARDLTVRVALALCDLAELGVPSEPRFGPDEGCAAHIRHCLQLLLADQPDAATVQSWLTAPREAFRGALHVHGTAAARASAAVEEEEDGHGMVGAEADALVSFRQLRSGVGLGAAEMTLDEAGDLSRATGFGEDDSAVKRVHPLTGSGDPVYAEATVTVHDYDMLLDIASTNASADTLDNCTLELYTQGDLKLVERPAPFTLAPGATHRVSVSVKVSSTETGCIFGSISFDTATRAENRVLHLDAIPLDLMDYLRPADCDLPNFRKYVAPWARPWARAVPAPPPPARAALTVAGPQDVGRVRVGEQAARAHHHPDDEGVLGPPVPHHAHEVPDAEGLPRGRRRLPGRQPLCQNCLWRKRAAQRVAGAAPQLPPRRRLRPHPLQDTGHRPQARRPHFCQAAPRAPSPSDASLVGQAAPYPHARSPARGARETGRNRDVHATGPEPPSHSSRPAQRRRFPPRAPSTLASSSTMYAPQPCWERGGRCAPQRAGGAFSFHAAPHSARPVPDGAGEGILLANMPFLLAAASGGVGAGLGKPGELRYRWRPGFSSGMKRRSCNSASAHSLQPRGPWRQCSLDTRTSCRTCSKRSAPSSSATTMCPRRTRFGTCPTCWPLYRPTWSPSPAVAAGWGTRTSMRCAFTWTPFSASSASAQARGKGAQWSTAPAPQIRLEGSGPAKNPSSSRRRTWWSGATASPPACPSSTRRSCTAPSAMTWAPAPFLRAPASCVHAGTRPTAPLGSRPRSRAAARPLHACGRRRWTRS